MAYIFIHLFIPLSKIHRFPFHSMSHDLLHYYLFCCSNCFIFGWWKHLQAGSCVIFNRSSYIFETSLLFGTIRCSRPILNLACLSHFSKELCCSWRTETQSWALDMLLAFKPSQWTDLRNIYMFMHMYTHVCIYVSQ